MGVAIEEEAGGTMYVSWVCLLRGMRAWLSETRNVQFKAEHTYLHCTFVLYIHMTYTQP